MGLLLTNSALNVLFLMQATLKDRLDPGGEEDNDEKMIKVDAIVIAAGAWCEYLGLLADVNIPVCKISQIFII